MVSVAPDPSIGPSVHGGRNRHHRSDQRDSNGFGAMVDGNVAAASGNATPRPSTTDETAQASAAQSPAADVCRTTDSTPTAGPSHATPADNHIAAPEPQDAGKIDAIPSLSQIVSDTVLAEGRPPEGGEQDTKSKAVADDSASTDDPVAALIQPSTILVQLPAAIDLSAPPAIAPSSSAGAPAKGSHDASPAVTMPTASFTSLDVTSGTPATPDSAATFDPFAPATSLSLDKVAPSKPVTTSSRAVSETVDGIPLPPEITSQATESTVLTGAKPVASPALHIKFKDSTASSETVGTDNATGPADSDRAAVSATTPDQPVTLKALAKDNHVESELVRQNAATALAETPQTHQRGELAAIGEDPVTPSTINAQAVSVLPPPSPTHSTVLQTGSAAPLNLALATAVPVPVSGLAVDIALRAASGKNRFDITLDPAELGRIEVRLDMDKHGQVTSHLTVERPATLDMLRRDAPQLQRALEDAGLKTGDNGLQFSLRDQSSSQGQDDASGRRNHRFLVSETESNVTPIAGRTYGRMAGAGGGVDIRV